MSVLRLPPLQDNDIRSADCSDSFEDITSAPANEVGLADRRRRQTRVSSLHPRGDRAKRDTVELGDLTPYDQVVVRRRTCFCMHASSFAYDREYPRGTHTYEQR
jgi:hypothetical protein